VKSKKKIETTLTWIYNRLPLHPQTWTTDKPVAAAAAGLAEVAGAEADFLFMATSNTAINDEKSCI
jgi:hypothetical protein